MLYIFITLIGATSSIFAWYLYRVLTVLPHEKRDYLDKPTGLFKLLWYPIRLTGFYIKPLISIKTLASVQQAITLAGVDYVYKPLDIVSARFTFGLFFFVVLGSLLFLINVPMVYAFLGLAYGLIYPSLWLKSKQKERMLKLHKELPFFLDIITLCVEAGLSLTIAMQQAVEKAKDGPVRREFTRVLRDVKAGETRSNALRGMAERIPDYSIKNLISSIIQSESMGASLGPILRSQAEQKRIERFLRAEKLAMEAPVKMLLPLVAFIFPCTFIVIGFPIYVLVKQGLS